MSKRSKTQKQAEKRYDSKRAGLRTRNWTIVFYPEDLPEDWEQRVNELLIKWIRSPLHDQDLNADGKPKKPHYHSLFLFSAVKTQEQVENIFKELFGESEEGSIIGVAMPQMVNDRTSLIRYMAHLDNPEKAQYDPSEIVGYNGVDVAEILRYSATETREMVIAMEEFIENHRITELSDFSQAIRYDYPEWHTILTTKMTVYFSAFIKSRRHKALNKTVFKYLKVDPETGEILNGSLSSPAQPAATQQDPRPKGPAGEDSAKPNALEEEITKKKGGRPTKRPSDEELAKLYSKMTAREIAERFNVSVHTVRNWISKARKDENSASQAPILGGGDSAEPNTTGRA